MHELKEKLETAKQEIENAYKSVNPEELKHRITQLETLMSEPGFWDNTEKAQEISQEVSHLQDMVDEWEGIKKECDDLLALVQDISPEESPKMADELHKMVDKFEKKWRDLVVTSFLNKKYDKKNAILSIHAGTGGTDAQDFSEMLLRMYLRYAEKKGFSTQILEKSEGDEAGIKSATILIKGPLAYGLLKSENGVHRLVRLSPFNVKHTRETSFALVEVLPELNIDEMPDIKKDDLRIDTYRASTHGGQSVNTTDSAVRITHIPTGVTAQCQNERSQVQNKEQAMKILYAKLQDLKDQKAAETIDEIKGGRTEIKWGNQIRSYVLHPYTMVKDHRTKHETSKVEDVLDGSIESFIRSYLEYKYKSPKANVS
jgi:peptide chain release factor 2